MSTIALAAVRRIYYGAEKRQWNRHYLSKSKLNDNLLFGGGGQFFYNEPLTAPFITKDSSILSLDEADECIYEYMKVVFDEMPPLGYRSYILCGKNKKSEMCLFHYDFDLSTQETTIYKYNSVNSSADYSCIGLPPKLTNKEDYYRQLIERVLENAKSDDDVIDGIYNIIKSVSEIDSMVGGNPEIIILH